MRYPGEEQDQLLIQLAKLAPEFKEVEKHGLLDGTAQIGPMQGEAWYSECQSKGMVKFCPGGRKDRHMIDITTIATSAYSFYAANKHLFPDYRDKQPLRSHNYLLDIIKQNKDMLECHKDEFSKFVGNLIKFSALLIQVLDLGPVTPIQIDFFTARDQSLITGDNPPKDLSVADSPSEPNEAAPPIPQKNPSRFDRVINRMGLKK